MDDDVVDQTAVDEEKCTEEDGEIHDIKEISLMPSLSLVKSRKDKDDDDDDSLLKQEENDS
ncbi:hypothetical protein Ddye_008069 [Dipteronia dyeriana]|uniref:Uncharacterized protein n=1 Tax=Dipteronia dyeriana TaxID=168575 RepID=A0AAE0CKY9_9ROSI|nr:hypothetical protein Ddye_008069 [Dipteronia dyeriana]